MIRNPKEIALGMCRLLKSARTGTSPKTRYKGYDTSDKDNTNILSYEDFAEISDYAIESMQYAVGSGLMKGKTQTALNPGDYATRAETAAILCRFMIANK